MPRLFHVLIILVSLSGASMNVLAAEPAFQVLCYHDVTDDGKTALSSSAMSISTDELIRQFSWLREHGYNPVSLNDIRDAKAGLRALPDKAVVLTFDDGYQSFYTRVLPLLKMFDYPAVLALVGTWMQTEPEAYVQYGENKVSRKAFMSWEQVKQAIRSGLVELASHSYDLHKGILANPHDNRQPAAITRLYDETSGSYETDRDYKKRILSDLKKSSELIYRHTGYRPKALVWPFGAYNQQTVKLAGKAGFDITLTLEEGVNTLASTAAIKRYLVGHGSDLADLIWGLYHPTDQSPVRVAHVDLDYIYDENSEQQSRNLDRLLDRIKDLKISTVYLQAFSDADGDGNADALYFPNPHLPVRADLFNRVTWQLKTRAEVEVYAWLPLLAYTFPEGHEMNKLMVQGGHERKTAYQRLSPFHENTRPVVADIYRSLAKNADIDGLLFHDDAMLDDYEDASPWALQYYKKEWGLPASVDEIRQSSELLGRWSRNKTQLLIDWTDYLTKIVQYYRPDIRTVRNIYARVILEPESEIWYSQSFNAFLDNYDYTAIMAMPFMENAGNDKEWLQHLIDRVSAVPGALDKSVFELQTVDWRDSSPVDSVTLFEQMRLLQNNGAYHFGYYPEDMILDHPDIDVIRPAISLSEYPYR